MKTESKKKRKTFYSHCASEPLHVRRRDPRKLLVRELKDELGRLGYPTSGKKEDLVQRLQQHLDDMQEHTADFDASDAKMHGYNKRLKLVKSSKDK